MSIETSRENIVQEFELLSLSERVQEVTNVLGEQARYMLPEDLTITQIRKESFPSRVYVNPQEDYQKQDNATPDVTMYTIYFADGSQKVISVRQSRQGSLRT